MTLFSVFYMYFYFIFILFIGKYVLLLKASLELKKYRNLFMVKKNKQYLILKKKIDLFK